MTGPWRGKIFPLNEGYIPYIYLANMCIPIYFMLQEPLEKLISGIVLLLLFIFLFRQFFWSPHQSLFFITSEMTLTIVLSFFYDPMFLYIIFVFMFQSVRLPIKQLMILSGIFTFFSLVLIFNLRLDHPYMFVSLIPPLFGGSGLPFIMRATFRYKEMSEKLKRTAEELAIKNREKTLLEESKKRMLSDISHDLKTPMTTIQGYSKALHEGIIDDPEQVKKYIKYIYNKSIRVTTLIDELFMFSKLDNPDVSIHKVEKDLCEFLREVLVEYYEQFDEKEMKLLIDIPAYKINYWFDQPLFYRAISNILENTVHYNPVETLVFIRLRTLGNYISIEIGDNGTDMLEEFAESLFDPFVRGDKSRMNDGGSGLGLSITKKIIELHNGRISLDTRPKRGKKNFVIELPIRKGV